MQWQIDLALFISKSHVLQREARKQREGGGETNRRAHDVRTNGAARTGCHSRRRQMQGQPSPLRREGGGRGHRQGPPAPWRSGGASRRGLAGAAAADVPEETAPAWSMGRGLSRAGDAGRCGVRHPLADPSSMAGDASAKP